MILFGPQFYGLFCYVFIRMMATFGFEICNEFIQDLTCCTIIHWIAPVSQLFKNVGNDGASNFALR